MSDQPKPDENPQPQETPIEFPSPQAATMRNFNYKTGWFWVGFHVGRMDEQGAKDFISASAFDIHQLYNQIRANIAAQNNPQMQKIMAQIKNGAGKFPGIRGMFRK